MNPNRLSIEELLELKPSMDNPIELVCDDGTYVCDMLKIKVLLVHGKLIIFENDTQYIEIVKAEDFLHHYPSFKQPKKRNLEVFYEGIIKTGGIRFCSGDKYLRVDTNIFKFEMSCSYNVPLPSGRKLIYDHDNKELLAWDEELLR